MDPNANLAEQERILTYTNEAKWAVFGGKDIAQGRRRAARELSELRWALYGWLQAKGFAPDWSKAPNARQYYGR
jgi:hypothetical protein